MFVILALAKPLLRTLSRACALSRTSAGLVSARARILAARPHRQNVAYEPDAAGHSSVTANIARWPPARQLVAQPCQILEPFQSGRRYRTMQAMRPMLRFVAKVKRAQPDGTSAANEYDYLEEVMRRFSMRLTCDLNAIDSIERHRLFFEVPRPAVASSYLPSPPVEGDVLWSRETDRNEQKP